MAPALVASLFLSSILLGSCGAAANESSAAAAKQNPAGCALEVRDADDREHRFPAGKTVKDATGSAASHDGADSRASHSPGRVVAEGFLPIVFTRKGADTFATAKLAFVCNSEEPLRTGALLTYELLDASGESFQTLSVEKPLHIASKGAAEIRQGFRLTRAEYLRLRAVRVTYICRGVASRTAASAGAVCSVRAVSEGKCALRTRTDARKQARLAAKREKERRDHEAAWRARFPIDDYSNTLLIGDSLMQNATASLQEVLPGVQINADAGRTLESGGLVFERKSPDAGVLDHVRGDDGSFERYVIGTGNNDIGGMPLEAAEEIVACLGADKEIYFITEIVVGNSYGTDVTNAAIDDVVARYPNVHKIDWHGLVEGHETEYLSDGTHARPSREPDYAACIKKGLDVIY